ncbi:MAG: hypothetical protein HWD61_09525 [Parachlamydiaceae bacterium]|nr:MAG: hypothetical protein HWD61_09525 [Parachlamydiaceae bacterium]
MKCAQIKSASRVKENIKLYLRMLRLKKSIEPEITPASEKESIVGTSSHPQMLENDKSLMENEMPEEEEDIEIENVSENDASDLESLSESSDEEPEPIEIELDESPKILSKQAKFLRLHQNLKRVPQKLRYR